MLGLEVTIGVMLALSYLFPLLSPPPPHPFPLTFPPFLSPFISPSPISSPPHPFPPAPPPPPPPPHPDTQYMVLYEAVRHGKIDSFISALSSGMSVDCRDKYNKTPLMVASSHGRIDVVKFLLDKG